MSTGPERSGGMRFHEILRLVWINIAGSRFKVFLTSLGVIVGAATIILVVAVGHGGEVQVQSEYKTLNAGSIHISVSTRAEMQDQMIGRMPGGGDRQGGTGGDRQGGAGGGEAPGGAGGGQTGGGFPGGGFSGSPQGQSTTLSASDVDDISELVPGLTVVGASADYREMCNLELLEGDFIADEDEDGKSKVAVIGYTLAQDIFGSAYAAYGDTLSIEGKTYEIIGVLNKMGSVSSGTSPDDSIFVPYSTAEKYIFGRETAPQIMAVASEVGEVPDKISAIKEVLAEDHPDANFTVTDAGNALESATSSAKTLSMLLLSAAVLVFIVGGIGIMNVMFVSVKERTQEIGILKALGTSRRAILLEFLLEATLISVLGGALGTAAGFALVPLVRLSGMTVEPLTVSGMYAMLFAAGTGTIFGMYPAWKASRLTPIEALAQE
jgi:putative ABC transport system permease protein